MTTRRARAGWTAALTGAPAAYWLWRRRTATAIASDPESAELARPVSSAPLSVTSADGTGLHAEVFGPTGAPTVVLVHGWCCSIPFWHYQLRDLSATYRLVAYDLRGHGRSERPRNGDCSTTALADDLHAVLDACVPVGEKVVLVGHSMGGMSIVAWAGAHPGEVARRVAGVVLVDTGMAHLVARSRLFPTVSLLAQARTALGGFMLGVPLPLPRPPDPLTYRAIRLIAVSRGARPAHVAFAGHLVAGTPARVRAAFGLTLAGLDLTASVPHLAAVPTTVLVGADDVLTPVEQSRALADAVPGATLTVLPRAGHMAPVEADAAVTGHIRAMAESTLPA